MLPPSLHGRYVRYKTDTATFATWLQLTALDCGYTTTALPASKNQQSNHGLTISYSVKELLAQAKAVAASKTSSVTIPPNVLVAAQRAILARQEISEHFHQIDAKNKFNASHAHFIQVLNEALFILKPL